MTVTCPYLTLLSVWSDLYWDTLSYYPVLWLSLLFHLGTTILATVVAHGLKFREYRLHIATNAWTVLLGCLLCWSLFFLFFLENFEQVASGKAMRRDQPQPKPGRWICPDVALGLAGIFIIYGIWGMMAPAQMRSRLRINESRAISLLKRYATGQDTFRKITAGGDAGVGERYCDDFRRLYYGENAQKGRLELVPRQMADTLTAFSGDDRETAARYGRPCRDIGYVFLEDPYITQNSLWETRFGLVAYPLRPGTSGSWIFWIGEEHVVKCCAIDQTGPLSAEQSPLHPKGAALWGVY